MDLYNRYLLRASGERAHAAGTVAEAATYAALSAMQKHGLWSPDRATMSAFAEDICKAVDIAATDRFLLPKPPLQPARGWLRRLFS